MKTYSLSTAILMSLFLMSSCKDVVEGSGNYITENRTLAEINAIETSGDFNIILHKDSVKTVRIYAEDNIAPELVTQLKSDNTLSIYYRDYRTRYKHSKIDIYVPVTNFRSADISGVGTMTNTSIQCDDEIKLNVSGSGAMHLGLTTGNLKSNLSGSGTIELWGSSVSSDHTISGSGNIKTFGLLSKNTKSTISGSGNCEVNVSDLLTVNISGSGNVLYIGSPQITQSISGSGKVRSK